jgi:hypothetical protein
VRGRIGRPSNDSAREYRASRAPGESFRPALYPAFPGGLPPPPAFSEVLHWTVVRSFWSSTAFPVGLMALALTGCGGPTTGTVDGTFADLHGPYATGTLAFAGTVTLTSPSRSYSVDVGPSGHFTLQVEPGTYRVSGVSPTYHGPTCSGGSVHVVAGRRVTVNVSCFLS